MEEYDPLTEQPPLLSGEIEPEEKPITEETARPSWAVMYWEWLSRAGLAEGTLRVGTHLLLFALVLGAIWVMGQLYLYSPVNLANGNMAFAASAADSNSVAEAPALLPYPEDPATSGGIVRQITLHTTIPDRPRIDVITYTVKKGDTLFGIAKYFNLEPETLLWGNQFVLGDNPESLRPDQVLSILPVNGAYYRWQAGDGLNAVSKFFSVTPDDIVNWPGNHLDVKTVGDYAAPNIKPGTWLVIPNGKRAFVSWSAPEIPRDNPGVAKVLGPGACGAVANGALGVGLFIWPSTNHFLSGYDYSPRTNHYGIDIDGDLGIGVFAVDNGVIVYAGWNNWGYGNVIVINHGNGWQTLYAHLSNISVTCGQSVWQGNMIGAIGTTGNSSGPHLHFEMMYNGTRVNPWDYLPK